MKKVFIAFCIVTMIGMVGWRLTKGGREQKQAQELLLSSSDAREYQEKITILGDEWLGYLVFRSRGFQEALATQGIGVVYRNEPDFQKRFELMARGEADLVLATADSYLTNGASTNYPGVIPFVIDESFGGDALIARAGIESIDDLNSAKIKGAFVGHSPSEFLMKSQLAHFQLGELAPKLKSFRKDSATECYQALSSGAVDFAVLWEPYASKVLQENPDFKCLIDTSQARDLIIDVAVASRTLAAKNPALLEKVMGAYFQTLAQLQSQPAQLLRQATIDSGEKQETAKQMLAGIRFANYTDNQQEWFNGTQGMHLQKAISGIAEVLREVKDLPGQPDVNSLIYSKALQDIARSPAHQSLSANAGASAALGHFFRPLQSAEWAALSQKSTGTLMNRPIEFASGSSEVPAEVQAELLQASQKMQHYPYHRLIVQAHVSPGGGVAVEKQLSQERAEFIRQFLLSNTDLSPERIYAIGMGAEQLLPRKDGESSRAWKRRCRRARVLIAAE